MFNLKTLKAITSISFVRTLTEYIAHEETIRSVMSVTVNEVYDEVVVDVLSGWNGEAQILHTFRYDRQTQLTTQAAINRDDVEKFLDMAASI